jgi:phosphate transport system protein
MNEHISSAYDRDLESIQTLIVKMGGMVEHAILEAAKALESRDIERADVVRKGDKAIDALEEQINEEAARTFARPVVCFETCIKFGTSWGLC